MEALQMRRQPPVDLTGALGGPRLADLFREREGDALIITNSSLLQRTGFFSSVGKNYWWARVFKNANNTSPNTIQDLSNVFINFSKSSLKH
jgi:hypothetical protein